MKLEMVTEKCVVGKGFCLLFLPRRWLLQAQCSSCPSTPRRESVEFFVGYLSKVLVSKCHLLHEGSENPAFPETCSYAVSIEADPGLWTQPTADVTISLSNVIPQNMSGLSTPRITVSPTSVTFTPADFRTPQSIVVQVGEQQLAADNRIA